MTRKIQGSLLVVALSGLFPLGCQSTGVGDPCTPEDEYSQTFNGFNQTEVNVESKSFQCETRVCLVNHFRGRVSCKYGQDVDPTSMNVTSQSVCCVPGQYDAANGRCVTGPNNITVSVRPQLANRKAEDSVYCSCRCDGPDKNARYCQCPSGYACTPLVDDLQLPGGQLAGSYCIKDGTKYDPTAAMEDCSATTGQHGDDGSCGASKR